MIGRPVRLALLSGLVIVQACGDSTEQAAPVPTASSVDQTEIPGRQGGGESSRSAPVTTLFECGGNEASDDADEVSISDQLLPESVVIELIDYELEPYDESHGVLRVNQGRAVWLDSGGNRVARELDDSTVALIAPRAEAADLAQAADRRVSTVLAVPNFLESPEEFYGFALFVDDGAGLEHLSRCGDSLLDRQYAELGSGGADGAGLTSDGLLVEIGRLAGVDDLEPESSIEDDSPAVFATHTTAQTVFVRVAWADTRVRDAVLLCLDQPGSELAGRFCVATGDPEDQMVVTVEADPALSLEYWLADAETVTEVDGTRGSVALPKQTGSPEYPGLTISLVGAGDAVGVEVAVSEP